MWIVAAGWSSEAYILAGRADLAALAAAPQPAQRRAPDAAPPAAMLIEGFSAACDTPAGHRPQRRRPSKGGGLRAGVGPPLQRGNVLLPYQQRLLEPGELFCARRLEQQTNSTLAKLALAASGPRGSVGDCRVGCAKLRAAARVAACMCPRAAGDEADGTEGAQAPSARRPPGVGHGPAVQRFAGDLRLLEVQAHCQLGHTGC